MAVEKRHMLTRGLEGVLLVSIIVAVWLVMVLPVVIYFLVSDSQYTVQAYDCDLYGLE